MTGSTVRRRREQSRRSPDLIRIRSMLLIALVAAGGVVVEAVAARSVAGWEDPPRWLPDLLVGWTLLAAGLWARRGPGAAMPTLLTAAAALWFLGTAFPAAAAWHRAPLIHALAATPAGWSRRLPVRVVVAVTYPAIGLLPGEGGRVAALLLFGVAVGVQLTGSVGPAAPWARWAAAFAGTCWAAVLAAGLLGVDAAGEAAVLLAYQVAVSTVGLTCGACAASARLDALPDRVLQAVELGAPGAGALQDALRRSTADPSIVVALWDPQHGAFLDTSHRAVRPDDGRRARATIFDRGAVPVALLQHDKPLTVGRPLREAVLAAVSLLATHAELRDTLAEHIEQVRRSRRRLLLAADAERQALARELTAGAA